MAIPAYTTDLQTFHLLETAPTMDEFSGLTGGRSETDDTDYEIQGSQHISKQYNATGLGSLGVDYGSNITWTSGWNFFMWGVFLPAGAVNTYANGGLRMIVGSSINDHNQWIVGGSDFGSYPYGGWQNFVVDPEETADYTVTGTPGANYRWVGMGVNVISAISKGNPFGIDAIRFGRGEFRVVGGQAANYATFAGMAAINDLNANMWGLFQAIPGGYLWKGLVTLGYGALVDFRDSNKSIVVDDTRKVLSSFNRIEVKNTGSNIEWTNINVTALGSVAAGEFEMIDNADVAKTGCVFTDLSTFGYLSNGILTNTTWRRCGLVTAGGATFTGCIFEETSDTAKAVLCASPAGAALITNSTFISSGTGHAIEIGGTAANITLAGNIFTGYDQADPGTAANKAIYVNIASGSMTITVSGGSGLTQDSIRTAGATVTVNADVTVTFTGLKDNSEVRVYKVSDDSVVAGTEDATAGTTDNRTFSWSAPASTAVYYRIICFQPNDEIYEPIEVASYTVPASDTSVAIIQRLDRNAEN